MTCPHHIVYSIDKCDLAERSPTEMPEFMMVTGALVTQAEAGHYVAWIRIGTKYEIVEEAVEQVKQAMTKGK